MARQRRALVVGVFIVAAACSGDNDDRTSASIPTVTVSTAAATTSSLTTSGPTASSSAPDTSSSEAPADQDAATLSSAQESDAKKTIEAFLEAYNSRLDQDAAAYIAPEFRARCGGDEGVALALGAFRSRDRLRYEVQAIQFSSTDLGEELTASATFITLTDSGDVIDDSRFVTIRLQVDSTSPHGWVLVEAFPPGVEDSCDAGGNITYSWDY